MSQVLPLSAVAPLPPPTEDQVRQIVRDELSRTVEGRLAQLQGELEKLAPRTVGNKATLVVFSGDMDKVLAALVIATGAAAMGLEVSLFHTFWGLNALRRSRSGAEVQEAAASKDAVEKAMAKLMPAGLGELSPSKMSFAGLGAKLFRSRMKGNGVQSPEELFELARELGVKFIACQMSMEVMGLRREELVDGVEIGGVGAYLGDAADSKVTLFI